MTEKDKIALRKPLAPKTDDADCKNAHEELAERGKRKENDHV